MSDTDDLNGELRAAIPDDMHPYAYVFMHPPMENCRPTFEPEEMNALARHLERLGFRPVGEQLDRYEPPKFGPIHPHNPGKWVKKNPPQPQHQSAAEQLIAQFEQHVTRPDEGDPR